jgi:hypothetical protein
VRLPIHCQIEPVDADVRLEQVDPVDARLALSVW